MPLDLAPQKQLADANCAALNGYAVRLAYVNLKLSGVLKIFLRLSSNHLFNLRQGIFISIFNTGQCRCQPALLCQSGHFAGSSFKVFVCG